MNGLKFFRLKEGLTQDQVARQVGIVRWRLSFAERGLNSLSDAQLHALGEFFGKPAKSLLRELPKSKSGRILKSDR